MGFSTTEYEAVRTALPCQEKPFQYLGRYSGTCAGEVWLLVHNGESKAMLRFRKSFQTVAEEFLKFRLNYSKQSWFLLLQLRRVGAFCGEACCRSCLGMRTVGVVTGCWNYEKLLTFHTFCREKQHGGGKTRLQHERADVSFSGETALPTGSRPRAPAGARPPPPRSRPAPRLAVPAPRRRPPGGRGWLAARPVAESMAGPAYPAWVTRWVTGQWRQRKRPPAIRPARPLLLADKVANRREQAGGECWTLGRYVPPSPGRGGRGWGKACPQPLWGRPVASAPFGVVPGSCATALLRLYPGKGHGGVRAGSIWPLEATRALRGSRGERGLFGPRNSRTRAPPDGFPSPATTLDWRLVVLRTGVCACEILCYISTQHLP